MPDEPIHSNSVGDARYFRTLADLQAMTAAGATRIGASASVKIVEATAA